LNGPQTTDHRPQTTDHKTNTRKPETVCAYAGYLNNKISEMSTVAENATLSVSLIEVVVFIRFILYSRYV
jgi:hypothetical protein